MPHSASVGSVNPVFEAKAKGFLPLVEQKPALVNALNLFKGTQFANTCDIKAACPGEFQLLISKGIIYRLDNPTFCALTTPGKILLGLLTK